MGNLTIEYRRRIAKLLSGKAIVAQKGTNHIDDDWTENTIYKGEIALNLSTGELVSSDGETIIQTNKGETIISGLQLYPVSGANNGANPLWINISSGSGTINGKTYWYKSVMDSSADKDNNGDFMFAENNGAEKYWLVYAYEDKSEYDEDLQQYKMSFYTFSISSFENLFKKEELEKAVPYGKSLDDSLFLGIVYMPAGYTSDSYNELRPWSVSIDPELSQFSLNHSSDANSKQITPGAFIDSIRKSIIEYQPDSSSQRNCMVLIQGMTFKSGANLYYVNKTHYCDDIDESLKSNYITQLTGTGEGEMTTNLHNSLKNLSYETSGHTGFQRQTTVSLEGPETATFTPKAGDFWINIDYSNVIQSGYVYIAGKGWVEFINCTKDSKNNKNLHKEDLNSVIFDNKQNDTFIALSVNGIMANYPEDYVFTKDGIEVELADIDSESYYKVEWKGDYELEDDDIISLYYIESAPIVIDTTDWNTLEGGSSTEALWN